MNSRLLIEVTEQFDRWFKKAKRNKEFLKSFAKRTEHIQTDGYLGDVRYLRDGVSELRFLKEGIRIYYTQTSENKILLLLIGGTKNSSSEQQRDIAKAVLILKDQTNG